MLVGLFDVTLSKTKDTENKMKQTETKELKMGIDVGSTTTKIVVLGGRWRRIIIF